MPSEGANCDQCGLWYTWSEFVETIEECLCWRCASGIDEDYDEDDYDPRG